MKTIQDFYFRDIDKNNLPTTIHFEEGNLFIENYQSGYCESCHFRRQQNFTDKFEIRRRIAAAANY